MTSESGKDRGASTGEFTPLEISDFSFYGFDTLDVLAERRIHSVGIRCTEPKYTIVDHAVIVPAVRASSVQQLELNGGVLSQDGTPIEEAHLRRAGWKIIGGLMEAPQGKSNVFLDEDVVYLGWLFAHFGHFLLESLSRTWILDRFEPSVRVAFHNPSQWVPKGTQQQILETLGIPLERILPISQPTRVRRLIIPEPLFELQHAAHVDAVNPYRRAASTVGEDRRTSQQPVYLSRRLLPSSQRPIIGEYELEDILAENGFLIAHPQAMSFADQVKLFRDHADVFSTACSAAHNVLFSLPTTRLHLLTNRDPSQDYFLCSKIAETPTTIVCCLGTSDHADFGAPTPQILDIGTVLAYLRDHGLLKNTLRASLSGRNPALLESYDEAWFFARIRRTISSREALQPDVAARASERSKTSWVVSAILAHYYLRHDPDRAEECIRQFIYLVDAENDINRLAHYRSDVENSVTLAAGICGLQTLTSLLQSVSGKFPGCAETVANLAARLSNPS